MPKPIEVLEAEVLTLSPAERAGLFERLIASHDADLEIQEAWVQEATRREAELVNGAASLVSGEEAMARLRAELR